MKVLWEPPEEPGPEVTAVSMNGIVFKRQDLGWDADGGDWYPGALWLDIVADAAYRSAAILDATTHFVRGNDVIDRLATDPLVTGEDVTP